MKKNLKLLIIILILGIITLILYKLSSSKRKEIPEVNFTDVTTYLKDIYGTTFLIPEFNNINDADESWLWENVNQYVLNHDDEYKEKNEEKYGYSYDDISKIVRTIYGENLKKNFPKGAVAMRYDSYNDLYGPTSYVIKNYYDYKIDSIIQDENIYTISIYDYTISTNKLSDEDNSNDYFEIFNNYDYLINGENSTPIIQVKSLNDDNFQNLLNKKDKLSHKIITIEYDESSNLYHIKSCKYEDTKPSETLANIYKKVEKSFEIMSIEYNYEDIYKQNEVLVKNFDELTSIYTENAKETYKSEMNLFVYKDNGEVYITAGDISTEDYISKIEFKDIEESKDKITCTVVRTFRKSFNIEDPQYNETYQNEDKFTIIKQNGKWLVDEFSFNNIRKP